MSVNDQGMPTFELTSRFERDWRRLTSQQRDAFRKVVQEAFVPDLDTPDRPFRPGPPFLRAVRVPGAAPHPGVFELPWARDGRAAFSYGEERVPGKAHVICRR